MLERRDPGLGDLQGHALPLIARSRQRQALGQCQRLAVELQMGAGIVLEKSDDELRPVGAAIVPEARLREGGRRYGCRHRNAQRRSKKSASATIHISPLAEFSIDETGADDMP